MKKEGVRIRVMVEEKGVQKLLERVDRRGRPVSLSVYLQLCAAQQRKWTPTPAAGLSQHNTSSLFSIHLCNLRHTKWTAAGSDRERKGSHGATKFSLNVFTPLMLVTHQKTKLLDGLRVERTTLS